MHFPPFHMISFSFTKPSHWIPFWDERGQTKTLVLDMITEEENLISLLSCIKYPQNWAPSRLMCMQCKVAFGAFVRQHHCRHCGSVVCGQCSPRPVDSNLFPGTFDKAELSKRGPVRVCTVCENILQDRPNRAFTSSSTEMSIEANKSFSKSFSVTVDM